MPPERAPVDGDVICESRCRPVSSSLAVVLSTATSFNFVGGCGAASRWVSSSTISWAVYRTCSREKIVGFRL